MAMGPEEKKKAYLLGGLAGVLAIVGLAVLQPWAGSKRTATDAVSSVPSGAPVGEPSAVPSGAGGGPPSEAPAAAAPGGAVASPQFVANESYRDDPFVPKYTKQLELPDPPPPPPAPTPVPTPLPPVVLPSADEFGRQNPLRRDRSDLPPFPGGNSRSTVLQGLPQARVSRLVNAPTAPRVQSAPPGPGAPTQVLERATNKRLAGVAIGDSVRALLEVQDATTGEFRTYIVQPGQRIDAENLQVLRIERTTEGGQSRVRMVVRENGETRLVELREGARPDLAGAGGMGGEGGYAGGSSGGYPGAAGGYPGAGGGFPGAGGGYPGASGGFPGGRGGFPGAAAPPGFPGGRPGFSPGP